ncbi:MAG: hypothetical protein LBL69_06750 [Zoogloeaceae bacterium]|jgi:hypothetical protein|nr:hypothetical protein [Zoogloeaceae bacterium]
MIFRFAPWCLVAVLLTGCGLRGSLIVPPATHPPVLERLIPRTPPPQAVAPAENTTDTASPASTEPATESAPEPAEEPAIQPVSEAAPVEAAPLDSGTPADTSTDAATDDLPAPALHPSTTLSAPADDNALPPAP